ncbi:MAG TPA: alpha/beta fold hydrolase [Chitinispirillaceae bacterium]|nr:alpha/beta fold hydrolase [Chitinispirillaceae bacterium]
MKNQKSTVILLPHAGGASHLYQVFADQLEDDFLVYLYDLPGHGRRSKEKLLESMEEVVLDLVQKIRFLENENWAVFGHSLGSLIAHALIRKRIKEGLSMPSVLFVSGTSSPVNRILDPISELSSIDFWSRCSDFGGISKNIIQNSEIRSFFEPILRNDFKIAEKYHPDQLPLPVPVSVFYGTSDMNKESAESWSQDSEYPLSLYSFTGDHFFLFDHCIDLCNIIKRDLFRLTPETC